MGFACVLHHLTLRFAAVSVAFCSSSQCVLQQIAVRFAAKSKVFCSKMRLDNEASG